MDLDIQDHIRSQKRPCLIPFASDPWFFHLDSACPALRIIPEICPLVRKEVRLARQRQQAPDVCIFQCPEDETIQFPDTPCRLYMPTLGWFWGSFDRHIWQSHGVSGLCMGAHRTRTFFSRPRSKTNSPQKARHRHTLCAVLGRKTRREARSNTAFAVAGVWPRRLT